MSAHEEVREQLAKLCHEQRAAWLRFPTPDADLTRQEKASARAEADRVLALLKAVLVDEYADVRARRGPWPRTTLDLTHVAEYEQGARAALRRLAERLGVDDLDERARRLPREEVQP